MNEAVSFRDYMQYALYGSQGYYMIERNRFGRAGDFYTSAQVSPMFGALWASFVAEWFDQRTGDVSIVELGCGDGDFAEPLLRALVTDRRLTGRRIRYVGIDLSAVARERVYARVAAWRTTLQAEDQARLFIGVAPAVSALTDYTVAELMGCFVFANELLDALPCHVVRVRKDTVEQLMVGEIRCAGAFPRGPFGGERLTTWYEPTQSPQLLNYARAYLHGLAGESVAGQIVTEAQTDVAAAIREIQNVLLPSLLAFVDYGGCTVDIAGDDRPHGSIRAFRDHQLVDSFLDDPGTCDLTYDVDFSVLRDVLAELGYKSEPLQRQGSFLIRLPSFPAVLEQFSAMNGHTVQAVKHLTLPGGMGDRFLVSIAQRQ